MNGVYSEKFDKKFATSDVAVKTLLPLVPPICDYVPILDVLISQFPQFIWADVPIQSKSEN